MTLTPSQQSAYQRFEEFINSDDRIFILKGSAGTGKTTLLKAFVDSLNDKGWKCVLMAPTGRAAYVLNEKTGHASATIHRSIYQIESDLKDDGTGQLVFSLRNNNDSLTRTVYIIDEASMIADYNNESDMFRFGSGCLLQDLIAYCGFRKIVFVGDYAQLPPVGQNISPAMSSDYLKEKYGIRCCETVLKELVRQKEGSLIYQNATFIRDAIEKASFNDFCITDGDDVKKSDTLIDDYFEINEGSINDNSIIIAYSNIQVLNYNQSIRKRLYSSNSEKIVPGELLIISQNNYSYPEELFNGTIVRVLECDSDDNVEKRKVSFYTSEKDVNGNAIIKEMELAFRTIKIETPTHNQIDCVLLDSFVTDSSCNLTRDYHQALRVDFNNRMSKNNIARGSDSYNSHQKTDKYLNAVICKYGYAITCHKAQGGEWDNVFVDMNSIQGKQTSGYFRWVYTAITRSIKGLWHYASPVFNAISKMYIMPISNTDKILYYVPAGEEFLNWHFNRISKLCMLQGISCSENKKIPYQHVMTFVKDGKRCVIVRWYNKSGYSSKQNILDTNDLDFSKIVEKIIELSLIPEKMPFEPKTDFALILHEFVLDLVNELGVSVLNIRQENWKDIYYLRTAPFESMLTFSYNAKGMYSSVFPQSTGGTEDNLLRIICEKIQ